MPAHYDVRAVNERFSAMMFLSSEVERLQAQVEADDRWVLEMEHSARECDTKDRCCHECFAHNCRPHDPQCLWGRRCDEARARQESKR